MSASVFARVVFEVSIISVNKLVPPECGPATTSFGFQTCCSLAARPLNTGAALSYFKACREISAVYGLYAPPSARASCAIRLRPRPVAVHAPVDSRMLAFSPHGFPLCTAAFLGTLRRLLFDPVVPVASFGESRLAMAFILALSSLSVGRLTPFAIVRASSSKKPL